MLNLIVKPKNGRCCQQVGLLLRNTQKSFTKFGGLLSENDQDIAERLCAEAEEAVKSGEPEAVNKALKA